MKTQPLKSPLRYPGGKANLADYMESFLRENLLTGCSFIEPFIGGAGLSLALLSRDLVKKCVWIEKDPLIFSLWHCILHDTENLCRLVRDTTVDIDCWNRLQAHLTPEAGTLFSLLENGLAGLLLNRMNFSGILHTRPIGGMEQKSIYKVGCRTNKDTLIQQIQAIAEKSKKISIIHGDALDHLTHSKAIHKDRDAVVYVDPPYLLQGKRLYRHSFTPEQHIQLAKIMDRLTCPWVVSIDNHKLIRDAYSNQKIVPIFLSYVVRQSRKAEELLVSNLHLDLPVGVEMSESAIRMAQ